MRDEEVLCAQCTLIHVPPVQNKYEILVNIKHTFLLLICYYIYMYHTRGYCTLLSLQDPTVHFLNPRRYLWYM